MLLSIDGSTKATGIAIYDNMKLIHYDCFVNNSNNLYKRLAFMTTKLDELLQQYPQIDTVVLEEVYPETKEENMKKNLKTHKALMYLQASFMILINNRYPHIKTHFFYPSEWRRICGIKNGRGIDRAKEKQYDIEFVKNKFKIEVNDDIADAMSIGWAYVCEFNNRIDF